MPNPFLGDAGNSPGHKPVTVIEATWTDIPHEVYDEIQKMWEDRNYGNDHYYHKWYKHSDEENYPAVANFIKSENLEGDILIHYWW